LPWPIIERVSAAVHFAPRPVWWNIPAVDHWLFVRNPSDELLTACASILWFWSQKMLLSNNLVPGYTQRSSDLLHLMLNERLHGYEMHDWSSRCIREWNKPLPVLEILWMHWNGYAQWFLDPSDEFCRIAEQLLFIRRDMGWGSDETGQNILSIVGRKKSWAKKLMSKSQCLLHPLWIMCLSHKMI
jgi:hypothetical protein